MPKDNSDGYYVTFIYSDTKQEPKDAQYQQWWLIPQPKGSFYYDPHDRSLHV